MRFVIFVGLLVLQHSASRTVPEEDSVVSDYTTVPAAANSSHGFDVYHLIANNIAEKITSPIYRFLGIKRNNTETSTVTTKRPFSKIEILDDGPEDVTKPDLKPVDNDISGKDVEELSAEALKKTDKKPEKITLYSSYLPSKITEQNETVNEVDSGLETFGFDDDDDVEDGENDASPREGPLVFILELIGSFIQLIYGGIASLFSSKTS